MHSVGEGLLSECSVRDPERRRLKLSTRSNFPCLHAATDHGTAGSLLAVPNFDHSGYQVELQVRAMNKRHL